MGKPRGNPPVSWKYARSNPIIAIREPIPGKSPKPVGIKAQRLLPSPQGMVHSNPYGKTSGGHIKSDNPVTVALRWVGYPVPPAHITGSHIEAMIRILLVDDHELVRTGIEYLLKKDPDINVVGVACSGEEAIEQTERLKPDVVIMDINMPGIGGIEACRKITRKHPRMKIVALSVYADGPFPNQLLSSGADGYVSKSCSPSELISAVRTVHKGKRYLSPDVASKIALASMSGQAGATPFDQLSYRELQIVIMTLQAKSTQDMAETLKISPKTVNTYRYRSFEKLAVKNNVELTRLATRYELISDLPQEPQDND